MTTKAYIWQSPHSQTNNAFNSLGLFAFVFTVVVDEVVAVPVDTVFGVISTSIRGSIIVVFFTSGCGEAVPFAVVAVVRTAGEVTIVLTELCCTIGLCTCVTTICCPCGVTTTF